MAPVPPQRLQTPILLGGEQALVLLHWLEPLGFNVTVVAQSIGVASAIKMCRSIMIKGLEALTTECLSTARQYGAEESVLASLHKSFPNTSLAIVATQPGMVERMDGRGLVYDQPFDWRVLVDALYRSSVH
ncbi:MAG TPA: hypothetical protein VF682_14805 [Pseudomonas sp.]|jgi:3-hydroxyisobutyrate dehydrogenase-like beta-hydroxyacid dehydrogenase